MNKRAEKINYKKANYDSMLCAKTLSNQEEPENKAISINQHTTLVSLSRSVFLINKKKIYYF
jgi:hypothetical protein